MNISKILRAVLEEHMPGEGIEGIDEIVQDFNARCAEEYFSLVRSYPLAAFDVHGGRPDGPEGISQTLEVPGQTGPPEPV